MECEPLEGVAVTDTTSCALYGAVAGIDSRTMMQTVSPAFTATAPVSGVLHAGPRTIGTFVLSIQDDEGYLRLARRLGGMYVLMYMGDKLVKNSLGPRPGTVPESGSFTYRGRHFRTFTLHASAFPSGPLLIQVLVPIPYA